MNASDAVAVSSANIINEMKTDPELLEKLEAMMKMKMGKKIPDCPTKSPLEMRTAERRIKEKNRRKERRKQAKKK